MIRYAGMEKQSVNDGPGIRLVVFLQGCVHDCPGCHNKLLQDVNGGVEMTERELADLILSELTPLHKGVTFSGGDPLLQAKSTALVIDYLKEACPDLDIWLYTGSSYEDIIEMDILKKIDVLVDGLYIEEKRDIGLMFCGSSNQRLIDIPRSLQEKQVVIWRSKWALD